jgi:alpha-glucosidase (family GH31 glycosyl hydrolase)
LRAPGRRSSGPLGIALAAAFAAGPAGAATLDVGDVRVRTADRPWALSFVERASGRQLIAQAPGIGPGPTGTLGFRAGGRWFHATRVIRDRKRGRRYRATLATNDRGGRTIALDIGPDSAGRLLVRAGVRGGAVSATGIAFRARRGERYLGFGERSNAVDQRGNEVENYVAEGPFEEDERALIPAFVPAWGFHPRPETTYYPMPWLLSSVGYGVLLDNTEPSLFRLGTDSRRAWSAEVEARELRFRVFAGPEPADVLRRLTAATGRQPRPPAPFVFGPWYQPRDDEEAILAGLRRADAPLSLAQTYTHYLPCADQVGRKQRERERVARFHAEGLAVTTYFNPMICTDHPAYAEAAAAGALARRGTGETYTYRYSTLESFDVAQFDFSRGRRLFGTLLREARRDGHDGWMEDFGEYTPLDSRFANGMSGHEMHNLYPTQYHCAASREQPRAVRFVRSGWTGTARCAPVVWGGDPTVDWGFDGLESSVINGITMGLSGVSTWGSDIGGFFALNENRLTPELLVRWIQFGAVSGVMRTQANGIRVPQSERPQVWDPEVLPHWRRWAKLRTQLYPYIAAADAHYRRTGLPLMRHLALAYPRDRRALGVEDVFLFGPDLLAAPVVRPAATRRRLYLPPGRWVDVWRSATFRESDGGLDLRRPRVLRGGRRASLPAPLAELPLLARAGTLLPLLAPDVDTLAGYGDRAPVTSLRERQARRVLLAFPRGRSAARLEDGGSLRSRELGGAWKLRIASERRRRWQIQASLATLERPFRPCRVSAHGGRLASWRYVRRTRVLHATLNARRAKLSVKGC